MGFDWGDRHLVYGQWKGGCGGWVMAKAREGRAGFLQLRGNVWFPLVRPAWPVQPPCLRDSGARGSKLQA